ncbi:MAG: hypothetical protein LC790_17310 [Actinobacteria bacterium]|nr:hypothetical protein [Actinomycetota bacterium]
MPEVDPAIRRRFVEALRGAGIQQRAPRAKPTDAEWAAINQPGVAAGKPDRPPEEELAAVFAQRQRTLSTVDRGVRRFRRSEWVGELSDAGRPLDEALDVIQARLVEKPDEPTLREAQIVLNDLGRLSGGGDLIARRLTQELVDQLISRGRG